MNAKICAIALLLSACESAPRTDVQTDVQRAREAAPSESGSARGAAERPRATRQGTPCAGFCERAASLGCKHQERCVPTCEEMADANACGDEMRAFLRCLSETPVTHLECDEEGMAALKEGFCNSEQEGVAHCAERAAR